MGLGWSGRSVGPLTFIYASPRGAFCAMRQAESRGYMQPLGIAVSGCSLRANIHKSVLYVLARTLHHLREGLHDPLQCCNVRLGVQSLCMGMGMGMDLLMQTVVEPG